VVVDVLVVGGGVIGVATANACAQRGLRVALCERHGLASAASGRNAGLVMGPHPPEMARIARRSVELWLSLHHQTGGGFRLDRMTLGYLVVAEDEATIDIVAQELPGAERLDGDALRELEPALAEDLPGGVRVDDGRRIDPAGAVGAMAAEARRFGVEVLTGCEVKELTLRRDGAAVTGAVTDAGEIDAGTVVVAAGPWSWRVCRSIGYDVPVRGVRGWIATTRPAPFRLRHPVEDHRDVWDRLLGELRTTVGDLAAGAPAPVHHAVLLHQDPAGRMVLGSSLMAATGDRDEGDEALAAIATRAVRIVPALADVEVAETRSCARPTTPDGLPLHGPVPGVERLVLACGHGPQGVTWGPGAGEAIAEGIATGAWDEALLPARFTPAADGV
jgi:glycine/D-amino acid oxidase-like deaminating enzyme